MGDVDELVESVVAAAARAAKVANREPELPPIPSVTPPRAGSRMAALVGDLRLGPDAADFLCACVARATDPRVGAHLRAVFGTEARIGLSVAQYAALRELSGSRVRELLDALGERTAIVRDGILVREDPPGIDARWTVPARVWRFLDGTSELEVTAIEPPVAPELSAAQLDVLAQLGGWLRDDTTLVLDGPTGSGRRTAAALVAKRRAVTVDFARVAIGEALSLVTALVREARLSGALPIFANLDELWTKLAPTDDHLLALARRLDDLHGPVVITTSMPGLELRADRRAIVRARWPLPDIPTRRTLWQRVARDASAADLDLVAERYALGAGGIALAARSAGRRAAAPQLADIVAGVQDNIAERLGELAHRVDVKQSWDELVLPPETFDDVRALVARVRRAHHVLETWGFRQKLARGTGVAALFSGPPGTGKTMVAGLLAKELALELYQVDLSRIVSKWVGETEKQLAKVFEAAEAGHALLLFDEADALFAKRSAEVKSATDRYANLEVNYLLQRVESFGGIVVLTTNLDTSIDPALRRRLASHIVFGPPEKTERRALWQSMLTTGAPLGQIDLTALADEFDEMTGANIRNSVLAAAFLAADEDARIEQAHLRRAARIEYRAMGRVLGGDHGGRARG